ncbi:MAG: acyl-CoA thioesterase [Caulobacterales bacterium]|nr:acyl-CoA thioesterase [Caulobacterales bacterium]
MKPPAWRQDRALYPHSIRVQTRYHDEDRLGHVNNIAVAAYYDEARSRLMRRTFELTNGLTGVRIVTADVRVSYMGEVFHPGDVEVASGILRIGNSSWEIGQTMFQNDRCVGVATTVLVQASAGGAGTIVPELRPALEQLLIVEP